MIEPRQVIGQVGSAAATVSSATRSQLLLVLFPVKPKGPPELKASKSAYDPGETLFATCTARPSQPSAELSFYINDKLVSSLLHESRVAEKRRPGGRSIITRCGV